MYNANQSSYSNPLSIAGRNGNAAFQRRMPGHVERLAKSRMKDAKKSEKISPEILKKILLTAVILLIAALTMFGTAHFFGDNLSRAGHSQSTEELEIVVGSEYLKVPANKIRFYSQRNSGAHEKLDIYIHWPSLSGYRDSLSADFNNSNNNINLIFMTIEQRNMSYDMSGRVGPIYEQFFEEAGQLTNIGLIKQPLSSDGGFIDEDLYYAASSPYPFAARCVREVASTTPFCIRDIHIGKNLMLTYRFHQKHLPSWIELEQSIRALTKSMIINPTLRLRN